MGARPVGATADPATLRAKLGGPLPEQGEPAGQVVEQLARHADPGLVATAGPRFFGFVIGGSVPAAVGADWLTSAWDQNAGLFVLSPAAAIVEETVLEWLTDLFGFPAGTGMGFVTGGQMANTTCLAAARHQVLARVGWDVAKQGLARAPEVAVLAGAEAHVTVYGALRLLGLGDASVVEVAADGQGRMIPDALRDALKAVRGRPTIVCAQAGNVNTGAFDPLADVTRLARENGGAWVHVDGAFGLWAAGSGRHRHLVSGIGDADSWATDAHKWLNTTYDSGIALVRDGEALRAAMRAEASYLPPGDGRDPMNFTPQSSQRARGAEAWAVLAALGRGGVSRLVGGHVTLARRFASGLAAGGLDILNEVRLNQVVAACRDAEATDQMIAALQREGTCWCGPTTWHGRRAMRVSISNWSTTQADVDRSIAAVLAAAR